MPTTLKPGLILEETHIGDTGPVPAIALNKTDDLDTADRVATNMRKRTFADGQKWQFRSVLVDEDKRQ